MRESGFQLRTRDPEPRPRINFDAELYKDGELLDTQALHTDFTDDGIRSFVNEWSRRFFLGRQDIERLVRQISQERDVRRPPPRML